MGVTMICSMVPISRSRTTAMLVNNSVARVTTTTRTPGTKKLRLSRLSLNQARVRKSTLPERPAGPRAFSMRCARICDEYAVAILLA